MISWILFFSWFLSPLLCYGAVHSIISVPGDVLIQVALNASFVARFTFFVALLLLSVVFFGELFKKFFKIPTIAGQIIGGIILGPSLIDIQHQSWFCKPMLAIDHELSRVYSLIPADLYVFFILLLSSALTVSYLLWIAGHETNIKELLTVRGIALSAGFLGAVVPIGLIGLALWWFDPASHLISSLGVGLIFAATSVSIPVVMLVASNRMHLKSSQATLGAAIVDDIIAVVLLSLFMVCVQNGLFGQAHYVMAQGDVDASSLVYTLVSMAFAILLMVGIGYLIVPTVIRKLRNFHVAHLMVPMANGIMFFYFACAELVGGLAGISGAYFSGLFHRMGDHRYTVERVLSPFVNAILLPLFLGSIGLQINLSLLTGWQWCGVMILLFLAIISKLFGCYLAVMLTKLCIYLTGQRERNAWNFNEVYLFGSAMVARGEVGLVIATILRGSHIISPAHYVISVVVIVLTTIVAPMMLSLGFSYADLRVRSKGKKVCTIRLTSFRIVGNAQMFNIIAGVLERHRMRYNMIRLGDGKSIITLERGDVKIVLSSNRGLVFEGDHETIMEILYEVKHEVLADFQKITSL